MGSTTFDGPIRAGNIFHTTGTTVGKNMSNLGYSLSSQTDTVRFTDTSPKSLGIYLPANSQIVTIEVCTEIAFNATTSNLLDVGDSGAGDRYLNGVGNGQGRGPGGEGTYKELENTGNWNRGDATFNVANWYNVSTASGISGDIQLTATYTGTPVSGVGEASAGLLRLNVIYIQGRNASVATAWGA